MFAGLCGGAIGVVALLLSLPENLFGRVAPVTGTLQVDPSSVAVIDGETLMLDAGVVRLRGVTAPARGTACRDAEGGNFDCGAASARMLATLVRDRILTCRLSGRDGHGFAQADCAAGSTNVNRAIVAAGWARVQAAGSEEDGLVADERQARAAGRGLWAAGFETSF